MKYLQKKSLAISCLLTFSIFSIFSCAYSSGKSLRLLKNAAIKTYDIIVVPGVPLENGKWSNTMKGRILWAKYLYDKGIARNIMFTGAAVYTPYVEAEVMALYAAALGVRKENIYTETKAEHSTENLFYSYKKAKKIGFKTIALASDPFQSKLLSSFARRRLNDSVGIIPMIYDSMNVHFAKDLSDITIDYQTLFQKDFISITKRESFWKRLRGTMGKNLDKKAYD